MSPRSTAVDAAPGDAPAAEVRVLLPGGVAPRPVPAPAADARWLATLPAARRVLAIGPDAVALADAHRARWPEARWWADALPNDAAGPLPAGVEPLDDDMPFAVDLVVLGAGFAGLAGAAAWLRTWSARCTRGAQLAVVLDNAASATRIEQLLQADLSPEAPGAEPAAPTQAPATFYKTLMDAGWMPRLADHEACEPADGASAQALRAAAQAVGVGPGQIDRVHRMRRLYVLATRELEDAPALPGPARFAVVVPTTEDRQRRANVEVSPGLHEVGARIVAVRHAGSPGEALAAAQAEAGSDWLLLCHQDIYFPVGFGERLNAVLAAVPDAERPTTVFGFAGIAIDRTTRRPVQAGHVIDRLHRLDAPASDTALSLDELAIVIPRDSVYRLDPAIGWHLWATELCLQMITTQQRFARVLRLPIFHNSRTGWTLPAAFYDSAAYLLQRYPALVPIHTLCGVLDAAFLARRPAS